MCSKYDECGAILECLALLLFLFLCHKQIFQFFTLYSHHYRYILIICIPSLHINNHSTSFFFDYFAQVSASRRISRKNSRTKLTGLIGISGENSRLANIHLLSDRNYKRELVSHAVIKHSSVCDNVASILYLLHENTTPLKIHNKK